MENVSNQQPTSPYSNGAEKYKGRNAQVIRHIKSDWIMGKKNPSAATADKRGLRRRDTVADLRATSNDNNGGPRWNGRASRGSLSSSPSVVRPPTKTTRSPTRFSLPVHPAKPGPRAILQGAQTRQLREELPARRSGHVPRLSYVKPDHHQMLRSDAPAIKAASSRKPQYVQAKEHDPWSESQKKSHDYVPRPPKTDESPKLTASNQSSGTSHWDTMRSPLSSYHSIGHESHFGGSRNTTFGQIHGLDLGLKSPADIVKPLRLSYYANPRQVWWRPSVSAEAPPPEHIEIVTAWLGLTPSIATMLFSIHNAFIECLQNILSPQLRTLYDDARGHRNGKGIDLQGTFSAANTQRILRFNRIELSTAMIDQLLLDRVLGDRDISMPRLVNLYLATLNHISGSSGENEQEASVALRVKSGEATTSQHTYVEALPTPDFLVFNQFNASPREGEEIVLQPSYRCISPYRTSTNPATVIYKASAPWLQWDGATGCFKGVVDGVAQYPPGLCYGASDKPHHGFYPLRVTIEATYICHGPVAPVWVERTIRAHVQFKFRPWQATIENPISWRSTDPTVHSCLGLNQPDLSGPDIYLKHVMDTSVSSASELAHDHTAKSKGTNDEQQQNVFQTEKYQRLFDSSNAVSLLGEKHGYLATRLGALAQEHAEANACCIDYCRTIDAISANQQRMTNLNDAGTVLQCMKARADTLSSTRSAGVALQEVHPSEKAALTSQRDDSADEQHQLPVKHGREVVGNHRRPAKACFVVRHHHMSQGSGASSIESHADDKEKGDQVICQNRVALLSDSGCELCIEYEDDDSKHTSTGKQSYEGDTTMDHSRSDVDWSAYSSCDPDLLLGATSMASSSTAEDKSRTNWETLARHRGVAEIDRLDALHTPISLQRSNNNSTQDDSSDEERMSPDEKLDLYQAIKDSIEEQTAKKMAGLGLPDNMDDIFDHGSSTEDEDSETYASGDADDTTGSQDEDV